jgi:hypothetical protein
MNPWEILQLPCTKSKREIKKSYFSKLLKHHPDKIKDVQDDTFLKLKSAYTCLLENKSLYTNNNLISVKDLQVYSDKVTYKCNCSGETVLFLLNSEKDLEILKDSIIQNSNEMWECESCSNSFIVTL